MYPFLETSNDGECEPFSPYFIYIVVESRLKDCFVFRRRWYIPRRDCGLFFMLQNERVVKTPFVIRSVPYNSKVLQSQMTEGV